VNGAADYHADCCDSDSGLWRLLGRVYALLPYRFHVILNDLELDGPRNWELPKAALREVREEIGLEEQFFVQTDGGEDSVPPFKRPFIAAAYNLRYRRDLNFYCCLRTHLRAEDIGVQRRKSSRQKGGCKSSFLAP
jgi:hypothetical protein